MQISDIRVNRTHSSKSKVLAYASCVINNEFFFGDLRIMLTKSGNFKVVFPRRPIMDKNGNPVLDKLGQKSYIQFYYPIKSEVDALIQKEVLAVFANAK